MADLFVTDVVAVGVANYPALRVSVGSYDELLDDVLEDTVGSGPYRSRSVSATLKRKFVLKHDDVTQAEKVAFDAFYAENRNVSLNFLWPGDGLTYLCYFALPSPKRVPQSGTTWSIDVVLREP